jgi:hypothetical protein
MKGLTNLSITAFTFDPVGPYIVCVGTSGRIFRRQDEAVALEELPAKDSGTI